VAQLGDNELLQHHIFGRYMLSAAEAAEARANRHYMGSAFLPAHRRRLSSQPFVRHQDEEVVVEDDEDAYYYPCGWTTTEDDDAASKAS